MWNVGSGIKVLDFADILQYCMSLVQVRPGLLAAVGLCKECKDGEVLEQDGISIYDPATGNRLQRLTGYQSSVSGVAVACNAVLTVCWEGHLRIWIGDTDWQVCFITLIASCARMR